MGALLKPPRHHQKRAKNNPVPTEYARCAVCGHLMMCQTHEVYGGTNRQNSIRMKYQVPVCLLCHGDVTNNRPNVESKQRQWRRRFQEDQINQWMLDGMSRDQAEGEWLRLIGRIYP